MTSLVEALVTVGLRVARFEFPYMAARREGGRRPPDREPVLRSTWHAVIRELSTGMPPSRLAIGGRSMGGRIATMVADESEVGAVVCFGYPFHPPKAPTKLRVAHLEHLRTRTLIVQGERDPFGDCAEVAGYPLSSAIELAWCPDGDHALRPRRRSGHTEASNLALAASLVATFLERRCLPVTPGSPGAPA